MTQVMHSGPPPGQTAWQAVAKNKDMWLAMIARDKADPKTEKDDTAFAEEPSSELVNYFFAALSPCPERFLSNSKDLAIMKKAISSIVEAVEENILTENEASTLLDFLATKFVGRRFASLLHDVFDVGCADRFKFHAYPGEFK